MYCMYVRTALFGILCNFLLPNCTIRLIVVTPAGPINDVVGKGL